VAGALWAWQTKRDHWVIPFLMASVLIKYVTLILIPIAVVAVWRRNPDYRERVVGILWTIAAALFLVAVSMYPFYDFGAIVTSAREQGARVAASPAWAVMASLSEWSMADIPPATVVNVAYGLAAIAVAGWTLACWLRPERLPRATFEVMFAFMLVASTNQRAWYVIWLVPLAAILIPETPWRRTLLWSVTAMIGHACTIWLWYVWDFDAWGYYRYVMIIVSVVYLPVIGLTLWELATSARTRKNRPRTFRMPDREPYTSPR
jgi:heme/copper-type cytochrome/quinol oxidase subunit 2